jgi:uncharacterized protein (TIGR03083 family)
MPSVRCPIVGAMDHEQALWALRRVTGAMATTVDQVDPQAVVPACPGWDVTSLVDHLGRVHLWAEHCARTGSQPDPYPGRDHTLPLPQWYAACAERLVSVLAVLEPEHPAWSFSAEPGHQCAGFWRRRQVHETAVHHVDALQAAGLVPGPRDTAAVTAVPGLEPQEVADGVGELFEVMVPRTLVRRRGEAPEDVVPATAPVAFALTDVECAWTLRLESGRARTTPGVAADAAAVVSGPAAHVYLSLWRRADPGLLGVEGDTGAGRRLLAASLVP